MNSIPVIPMPPLQGMTFTVLGLGDSNYTQFCRVPRALRSQVLALGAGEFHPGKDADEVDGLEDVVEAWLDQMLPALKRACLPTVAAEVGPCAPCMGAMGRGCGRG